MTEPPDTTTITGAACDGTTDDTTTLTGAQFLRHAGTDAEKWAEAFLNAAEVDLSCKSNAERAAYTAQWFRDYAEVCVAEEVGRVTGRLVPRHDE